MKNSSIALIPARAGSKRFPGKNTAPLKDKPLIIYTIDAVLESGVFEEIVVSTDDPKVVEMVESISGVEVHSRPSHLATDNARNIEVLLDILKEKKLSEGTCGIFQPTSPFRTGRDIVNAMEQLNEEVDSVIGVTDFITSPAFAAEFVESDGMPLLHFPEGSPLISGRTRKQQQAPVVHPNGAIYIAWIDKLLVRGSFFSDRTLGYMMDRISSIDIDEELDLAFASTVLDKKMVSFS